MIQSSKLEEGQVLNKWIDSRLKRNKNVLLAITGSTGSGKSYANLRMAELWYKYKFKEKYPVKTHTCFSISELMLLISDEKLRKGDLLILEEAGTSLNSLDFQNRISKLFSFIMQSFRSMNVILIFNLPILTMLNKSARTLLHGHFVTKGIDYEKEMAELKLLLPQINQERGKVYWKYMRIRFKEKIVTVKRFNFLIPSKEIREVYEKKKFRFVNKLSKDFSKELEQIDREEQYRLSRNDLTGIEQEIFDDLEKGFEVREIADRRQCSLKNVYSTIQRIKKKGFEPKIKEFY